MSFPLYINPIIVGESDDKIINAFDAINRLLLNLQRNEDNYLQLLLHVFGKSNPVDLSGLTVEILDGITMAGLHGAYTHSSPNSTERIYLNADWLEIADEKALQSVLLEEIGHAIDYRLNGYKDTPGDEGAVFSALVRGLDIPVGETKQNDNHTLNINGQKKFVEANDTPVSSGVFTIIQTNQGGINGNGSAQAGVNASSSAAALMANITDIDVNPLTISEGQE